MFWLKSEHLSVFKQGMIFRLNSEIKKFWSLALLRGTPSGLAFSYSVLVLTLLIAAAMQWGIWSISDSFNAVYGGVLVVLHVVIRAMPMWAFSKPERTVQTLTALQGTDIIIYLPLLIVALFAQGPSLPVEASIIVQIVYIWRLAASTFIPWVTRTVKSPKV